VDIDFYRDKYCVHPKIVKARWAKISSPITQQFQLKNHTFKSKSFGFKHSPSLKRVLWNTGLVLVLQKEKQDY
jgi:hypothetical protein